jgi:SAM-dependent methyltransferase
MNNLPFSPAAERNKESIGLALGLVLGQGCARVLEIGSGTGQHAVFLTRQFPAWQWQCSDLAEHLPELQVRLAQEGLGQLPDPVELDVLQKTWPVGPFDALFTANTLHIMPWGHTLVLLDQATGLLRPAGRLIVYGPFHDSGMHTAPSNEAFDQALKSRDPSMGVRDAIEITAQAARRGLHAEADLALPANNRILVFRKPGPVPG